MAGGQPGFGEEPFEAAYESASENSFVLLINESRDGPSERVFKQLNSISDTSERGLVRGLPVATLTIEM